MKGMFAIECLGISKVYERAVYTSLSIDGSLSSAFFQEAYLTLTGKRILQRFSALNKVDLYVHKGEVLGLLGPNGSGKSTLLKILSGLLLPDSGTIKIFGVDLTGKCNKIREMVSYAPGLLAGGAWLDPALTAKQNLMLMAEFFKKSAKDVDAALSLLGLRDVADVRIATFSSGMLARLLLAYNILNDKPIMMFDEPLAGMSPEVHRAFHEYILDQKKRGKTIIYVSQDIEEISKCCDRVAIMNKGRIVAIDKPEKLISMAGEEDVIDLGLDKPFTSIEELKAACKGVSSVTVHGNITKVRVEDYSIALPKIVNFLISNNYRIVSMKVHKPTLEDAFIKYIEEG